MKCSKLLTTNELRVTDSFHSAKKTVDQQPEFFTVNTDVSYLSISICLEKEYEIFTNKLFKEFEVVEGLGRFEFQEFVGPCYLHFIFSETIYR